MHNYKHSDTAVLLEFQCQDISTQYMKGESEDAQPARSEKQNLSL